MPPCDPSLLSTESSHMLCQPRERITLKTCILPTLISGVTPANGASPTGRKEQLLVWHRAYPVPQGPGQDECCLRTQPVQNLGNREQTTTARQHWQGYSCSSSLASLLSPDRIQYRALPSRPYELAGTEPTSTES